MNKIQLHETTNHNVFHFNYQFYTDLHTIFILSIDYLTTLNYYIILLYFYFPLSYAFLIYLLSLFRFFTSFWHSDSFIDKSSFYLHIASSFYVCFDSLAYMLSLRFY
mgnify:CR=1 FL=1